MLKVVYVNLGSNITACGARALAIFENLSLDKAQELLAGKKMRTVMRQCNRPWQQVYCEGAPPIYLDQIPSSGEFLCLLRDPWHYTVVRDGVIYDFYDPNAAASRVLHGYFSK